MQTAYSEIGDEESRRGHDLNQRINQSPFKSSSNNNMNTNSFNADDILRTFFEEQSRYQQRRKPAIYFNGIDISNLFSTSSNTFPFGTNNMRNPFTSDETPSSPTTQPQQQSVPKSIYEQEITIPLQDLYNGIDIYKFKINDTILQRYKAAFRGGIINWIATKGLFTFFIPLWFKSNNLPLCLFLFVGFIHTNLPRPNVLDYETSIQRGWKSGTKLKFLGHSCKSDSTTSTFNNNAGNCDVVFILKEEVHDTFVRKGNDLYTNVAISKSMARKGCKVVINALGKLEDPIKVLIPRGNMRDSLEKVFVVKGRGWYVLSYYIIFIIIINPQLHMLSFVNNYLFLIFIFLSISLRPKKRSKEKGDLHIHIKVIPDSQYYKDKKKKRVKKKKS